MPRRPDLYDLAQIRKSHVSLKLKPAYAIVCTQKGPGQFVSWVLYEMVWSPPLLQEMSDVLLSGVSGVFRGLLGEQPSALSSHQGRCLGRVRGCSRPLRYFSC